MYLLRGTLILRVAQQQPARGLEHPPGTVIVPQAIGLVDANPAKGLAPVLGHDVGTGHRRFRSPARTRSSCRWATAATRLAASG